MIHLTNRPIYSTVQIPVVLGGTEVPRDLTLLIDGIVNTSTTVTFTNLNSSGLCTFTFSPSSTGMYTLFGDSQILAVVEVVSRTIQDFLSNIEDEALGSWTWNKVSGVLTLLRQDGTILNTYTVVDSLTESERTLTP